MKNAIVRTAALWFIGNAVVCFTHDVPERSSLELLDYEDSEEMLPLAEKRTFPTFFNKLLICSRANRQFSFCPKTVTEAKAAEPSSDFRLSEQALRRIYAAITSSVSEGGPKIKRNPSRTRNGNWKSDGLPFSILYFRRNLKEAPQLLTADTESTQQLRRDLDNEGGERSFLGNIPDRASFEALVAPMQQVGEQKRQRRPGSGFSTLTMPNIYTAHILGKMGRN